MAPPGLVQTLRGEGLWTMQPCFVSHFPDKQHSIFREMLLLQRAPIAPSLKRWPHVHFSAIKNKFKQQNAKKGFAFRGCSFSCGPACKSLYLAQLLKGESPQHSPLLPRSRRTKPSCVGSDVKLRKRSLGAWTCCERLGYLSSLGSVLAQASALCPALQGRCMAEQPLKQHHHP